MFVLSMQVISFVSVVSIRSVFCKRNPPTSEEGTKEETLFEIIVNKSLQFVLMKCKPDVGPQARKIVHVPHPIGQVSCEFLKFL